MKLIFIFLFLAVFTLATEAQNKVIALYPGTAPGSESWNWDEAVMAMGPVKFAYNISKPTLTVFQADPSVATGKAFVVCPGGGFHFLSMDNEGYEVAKWLNTNGITAFVLKYRTQHCLTNNPMQEFVSKQPNTEKFNKDIEPIVAMGIADGKAAIAYVRSHATEYGVKPDQIGIMGFSAGGTVTAGVAMTYDPTSRPDFAAPIYPYVGSFGNPAVPADAPPIFIAAASYDNFGFEKHCIALYEKWIDAKKSAELHIYKKGGHGFGMQKQNPPTDQWINRLYEWLTNL